MKSAMRIVGGIVVTALVALPQASQSQPAGRKR